MRIVPSAGPPPPGWSLLAHGANGRHNSRRACRQRPGPRGFGKPTIPLTALDTCSAPLSRTPASAQCTLLVEDHLLYPRNPSVPCSLHLCGLGFPQRIRTPHLFLRVSQDGGFRHPPRLASYQAFYGLLLRVCQDHLNFPEFL